MAALTAPSALGELRIQLGPNHVSPAHECDRMNGLELGEREKGARDRRLGREIAPHGIQRDSRQGYASFATTRCSPA